MASTIGTAREVMTRKRKSDHGHKSEYKIFFWWSHYLEGQHMGHGGPWLKVQHPDAPLTQYFVSSGKVNSMSQIKLPSQASNVFSIM
jgi:hypothetical protein